MQRNGARPLAAPRFFCPASFPFRSRGWSLIELVVVLIACSAIAYFAIRNFQPRDAISLQQAERLRDDLRHAQMLAITWNQALRITTAATGYSVSCVTAGSAPCNASPVIDPASGRTYSVNLETDLTLAGPGFTLDLDALGRPKNGAAFISASATYTITGGSAARTVTVQPLTGFASAQ
jgi:type II secretory pathway pseudopilin PulG